MRGDFLGRPHHLVLRWHGDLVPCGMLHGSVPFNTFGLSLVLAGAGPFYLVCEARSQTAVRKVHGIVAGLRRPILISPTRQCPAEESNL